MVYHHSNPALKCHLNIFEILSVSESWELSELEYIYAQLNTKCTFSLTECIDCALVARQSVLDA